jgi:hypothetical protein
MYAPVTHILPLATIIRARKLPADGRIIARVGQKVSATDIVADVVVGRKYRIVDIAQMLKVSPKKVGAFLKVKKGQTVAKGEILAESTGFFAQEAVSPAEGKVVASGGGKIVLETGGSLFELVAGLPGVVSEVTGERGVVIRATGAIIQGLWGNGRLETGVMVSLFDKPDSALDPALLQDVDMRGLVVVAGHVDNPAVFKNAAELPLRGLILASITPALLPMAAQSPFPVILTDGFGRRAMNSTAFKLLTTNVKRTITINAEFYDRQNSTRPEIFIPLPVTQEPPEPREIDTFAPGQNVRVCYLLHPAQTGVIVTLRPGWSALPNGLKAPAAEVRLESGEQVLVPLTNLEVLG